MQQPNNDPDNQSGTLQKPRVIYIKPAMLAAIQFIGPYSETVSQAWSGIFNWLEGDHELDPAPDHGYGLTFHDPRRIEPSELRYAAGVVVPPNWQASDTDPVAPLRFNGGTFLRTIVVGPYANTGQVISTLRDNWIPQNGLVLDQKEPVLTIYRSDTRDIAPDDQVAEVCLPVFADRRLEPRD